MDTGHSVYARVDPPEWIPDKVAAAMLGKKRMWMWLARKNATGPTWYRIGHRIMYKKSDVEAYIRGCRGG